MTALSPAVAQSALHRVSPTLWEIPASARARACASRPGCSPTTCCSRRSSATGRWSSCRTSPCSRGSSTRRSRCPTSTRDTASRSAGSPRPSSPTAWSRPAASGTTSTAACACSALPLDASELGRARRAARPRDLARDPGRGRQARRAALRREPVSTGCSRRGRALLVRERGIGTEDDLERTESEGCLPGADPGAVSERARLRGAGQVGTIGSGNHFVEVQRIDRVLRPRRRPARSGCARGRLTVLIHSGSRGLGHQVCTDYVRAMDAAIRALRDHAPRPSARVRAARRLPRGSAYLAAMAAAANFAFANRHAMAHLGATRRSHAVLGEQAAADTRLVYDVAHNVAKIETRRVGGQDVKLCVHRRARHGRSAPAIPTCPGDYHAVGQPVLVAGQHGHCVLRARRHAGRRSSRRSVRAATAPDGACRAPAPGSAIGGAELRRRLEADGIVVRCPSNKGLAEEAPFAYKDVERVVDVVERGGPRPPRRPAQCRSAS